MKFPRLKNILILRSGRRKDCRGSTRGPLSWERRLCATGVRGSTVPSCPGFRPPIVALLTFTLGPSVPFSPQHGSLRPLDEISALTEILKGPTDPAHWASSSGPLQLLFCVPGSHFLEPYPVPSPGGVLALPSTRQASSLSHRARTHPPSPSILLRPPNIDPPPLSVNHPPASCTQTHPHCLSIILLLPAHRPTPTICQSSLGFLHAAFCYLFSL